MNGDVTRRRVSLLFFDAGGGHRAAAMALQELLSRTHPAWDVETVQLMEVLDPQGSFLRYTGFCPEDYYNKRLATGWTLGLAQELKLLQGMIRLAHAGLSRRLQAHWRQTAPDLVVSLVPNFNRVIGSSLATSLPGVPFVTVMTDLADHPPNFWIEPDVAQHVVCGTERASQQARAAGCPAPRVHRVSGMLLRRAFYEREPVDIRAERARLGLPEAGPVGLVLFGGQGSTAMLTLARQLHDQPLILMCGRNESLASRLRQLAATAPRIVVGFTADVVRWMAVADWFVGKPGPGSLSEAVQMGLPVVTVRNAWTMPQELYNTQWVVEQGLGTVAGSFRAIRPAVQALLADLPRYRAQVAKQQNRAALELPAVLAGVLAARAQAADAVPAQALASALEA